MTPGCRQRHHACTGRRGPHRGGERTITGSGTAIGTHPQHHGPSTSPGRGSGSRTGGRGARQRPGSAGPAGAVDGLKLHRHRLRLDGRDRTVLSLRPGSTARFATNHFHGTWHLLSDPAGARLLARLLWGLSYERHPDTLIVIDRPFLDPTPFEGEPSAPFVLAPRDLTPLGDGAARALRRALPLAGPPAGTVRWRTPGLDLALTDPARWAEQVERESRRHADPRAVVTRRSGLLVFAAPPAGLRRWAVGVAGLDTTRRPMDYTYLTDPAWHADGEVQVFRDYRAMVSSAVTARQEILAEREQEREQQPPLPPVPQWTGPGSSTATATTATTAGSTGSGGSLEERIWRRSAEVRDRRAARRTAKGRS
ncbi:hypothetical protein GCM10009665_16340 [Kitasatospora nipponensis]|uniref:Uncharacterized protein n=1 Tax=Kitasatospora nipponensis TaxID=258049 RepID=A0ABP4GJ28_9ACTN